VEDGKLAPKDALALNYLANPVEYYYAGTTEFAQAIRAESGAGPRDNLRAVAQFQNDNPGTPMDSTVGVLATFAGEALGPTSEAAQYLSTVAGAMPACMTAQ